MKATPRRKIAQNTTDASLVEFYRKHRISPVRQDISDLQRHFERREALYRHLGILPSFMKGKKILEVGPGSGSNSLYTASLEPSSYVLLEGNPTGVEDIGKLFSQYPAWKKCIRIAPVLLRDYRATDLFDFVLCEAVLTGVPDPEDTLRRVASFVAPGGILIITCEDSISYFPDTLRRLFAQLLIDPNGALSDQVTVLMPVFSVHLSRLQGMSRRHDDWIIDNLINPAPIGKLISIPAAISVVENDFDIYSSSPRFTTDWRWYKTIVGKERHFNGMARDQYWRNAHNLLDHCRVFPPREEAANRRLYGLCGRVRAAIREFEGSRNWTLVEGIRDILAEIVKEVGGFSREVADALAEAHRLLSGHSVDSHALSQSENFGSLFGRNLQYVSFTRKH